MKKINIFVLTTILLLTLCACSSAPENKQTDISNGITTSETTSETIPIESEDPAEPKEHLSEQAFSVYDDTLIEINFTNLLNLEEGDQVGRLFPLDDRYIIASVYISGDNNADWAGCSYSLIDTKEQKVVYTEQLNTYPSGDFKPYSEGGAYIYSYSDNRLTRNEEQEEYIQEYFITYLFLDSCYTEKTENPYERETVIMGDRVLVHIEGGIFEEKEGELIELLPALEEQYREGYWEIYADWEIDGGRYYYYAQIDDTRFLYSIYGYECSKGFGVYDFSTGEYTNAPDTSGLYLRGSSGNIAYSQYADLSPYYGIWNTDINTMETVYLLNDEDFPRDEYNPENYEDIYKGEPIIEHFTLSEDKQSIAFVAPYDYNDETYLYKNPIYIIDAKDGIVEYTYNLDGLATFAGVGGLYFFGKNKILISSGGYRGKDECVFIVDLT